MLSFVVKQVEPGQTKVNCQQVMMNKCICLLKNKKKTTNAFDYWIIFLAHKLTFKKCRHDI
jgi:hypothetical protein